MGAVPKVRIGEKNTVFVKIANIKKNSLQDMIVSLT